MISYQASEKVADVCRLAPVMPVIVIDDVSKAAPLAEALVAGGLTALEVTLRTTNALKCISAMAEVSAATVGAGTVLTPTDLEVAQKAGAKFGVSPGLTEDLATAVLRQNFPFLPGVATASEMMAARDKGFTIQKFFPAEINGGAKALAAFKSPLAGILFCPTGGVSPDNAKDYLALENVICVGGSWVVPKQLIADSDWPGITALAEAASNL